MKSNVIYYFVMSYKWQLEVWGGRVAEFWASGMGGRQRLGLVRCFAATECGQGWVHSSWSIQRILDFQNVQPFETSRKDSRVEYHACTNMSSQNFNGPDNPASTSPGETSDKVTNHKKMTKLSKREVYKREGWRPIKAQSLVDFWVRGLAVASQSSPRKLRRKGEAEFKLRLKPRRST